MSETNVEAKVDKIHETVHGIEKSFIDLKAEQKATNKSVTDLCSELRRYSTGTEKRLEKVEGNLGPRIPDDPTAFSQIQSLQGFRKRTVTGITMLWGLVATVVVTIVSQLFGWLSGNK